MPCSDVYKEAARNAQWFVNTTRLGQSREQFSSLSDIVVMKGAPSGELRVSLRFAILLLFGQGSLQVVHPGLAWCARSYAKPVKCELAGSALVVKPFRQWIYFAGC
jgi:hypothetical protein